MAKEIIEKGLKNRLDEIWGVECTLYYPEKYAGTADCVGVYEGKEAIIDFKQSNKPKSFLQKYMSVTPGNIEKLERESDDVKNELIREKENLR